MPSPQAVFDRFRPQTAWAPYFPHGGDRWDAAKVGHLYRRAAFGADRATMQSALKKRPTEVISRLLGGGPGQDEFDAEAEWLEAGALRSDQPLQLQAAWVYRMLYSLHPLRERMTLFWHDHFATSQAKVGNLRLMQRQCDVFRRHALGHFGQMLHEIARDPAMLIWLDANTNRVGNPNENLAREIFELFSLGAGNYSERDIKEAARALTGWSVRDGEVTFDLSAHDSGAKSILGQTGRWGAGDVVRIALEQPACARYLVRKVFREFVSETVEPPDELLAPLTDEFRLRDYDIAWLMKTVLSSWAFHSTAAVHQRVKSPIELLVGAVRQLEGQASPTMIAETAAKLGQSLFHPPSVKGWDGGPDWIDPHALLARQNLAFELTSGNGAATRCDPARFATSENLRDEADVLRFFLSLLLQIEDHAASIELTAELRRERDQLRRGQRSDAAVAGLLARSAAHLVMTLPEYQLA